MALIKDKIPSQPRSHTLLSLDQDNHNENSVSNPGSLSQYYEAVRTTKITV